ncbi:MAG TPA: peptide deformylase [Thermoleophilia bacterium]|nr:peptide deformylase [Thermoleophilia bacterium]
MHGQHGAVDRIRTFGDPVLKQETRDVSTFGEDLVGLLDTMFDVMDREQGIGLAAPQIGVQKRILVWRDPETEERHVLVNPRVVECSQETEAAEEGCLSIPGFTMLVERPDCVLVEGRDALGRPLTLEASGLKARILQHEIDHLDGNLILDRTSVEERRRVLKEIRQSMEQ